MLLIFSGDHRLINYAFCLEKRKPINYCFSFSLQWLPDIFEYCHPVVSHPTLIYTRTISMTPTETLPFCGWDWFLQSLKSGPQAQCCIETCLVGSLLDWPLLRLLAMQLCYSKMICGERKSCLETRGVSFRAMRWTRTVQFFSLP